ncbi:MAG: hypothetical protein BAJATHORv1_110038 [Candidatus Thorarchaeota archaeon]|nr:MAG: hypothetical protein BAJATHORv1_110038 [Candidatus Thorarchaeota archaeon]
MGYIQLGIVIDVDLSFAEFVIEYLSGSPQIEKIVSHPAAKHTYTHAKNFGNTNYDIHKFWTDILNRYLGNESIVHAIRDCVNFLEESNNELQEIFRRLKRYLPSTKSISCTLYANFGYDIGIVSEGSALINLGHSFFQEDHRELLYMSMHELHHAGYTHYNPIFTLADLKKTSDLLSAVRYATHLEGLAVYAPMAIRLEQKGLSHEDYQALIDSKVRKERVNEYFKTYRDLKDTPIRELTSDDMEILEVMSGRNKRLWYITGAHMAESIDKKLGRNQLVQTIVDGPESFFQAYSEIK